MKFFLYSFFHVEANFFMKCQVSELPPEDAAINTRRDCILHAPDYVKNGLLNCSLWCIGCFDDDSGEFDTSIKKCIVSQEDINSAVKGALGDVKRG